MSITDQFWQYAKEAILSASYAKTDEDRQGLLELARTWTQAALLERTSSSNHDSPAEASAAWRTPQMSGWPSASVCRPGYRVSNFAQSL
jgi:hypothetical protein